MNCFFVRDLRAPFGGAKSSGVGREGGVYSFDFYADVKNVCTAPWPQGAERRPMGGRMRMGEIVGAALVAHVPTIMLPEEVRLEINEGKEITLVPGLHRLKSECLDRLQPDTVIVFDTHWESTFEHIVTAHDRRQGKFTSHELPRGMKQIPYDMPGDPELANLIAAQAEGRDDCWILANDDPYLPLFYGTVNIWTFLGDPDTALAERGAQPVLRHRRLPAVRRADRQRGRAERPPRGAARVRAG